MPPAVPRSMRKLRSAGSRKGGAQNTDLDITAAEAHRRQKQEVYDHMIRMMTVSDIVPPETPKARLTGELAEQLQKELAKIGEEYSPLQFFETVMRHPNLPLSVRIAAGREALPYVNAKRAPVGEDGNTVPATALVVPGVMNAEEWAKVYAAHRKKEKKNGLD